MPRKKVLEPMTQMMMCYVWALHHQTGCNQREAVDICEMSLSTFLTGAFRSCSRKHISKLATGVRAFVDAAATPIKKVLQQSET